MINVIDSMCGSGKSTKVFQIMQEMYKENPNKRFLYVTPFLSEIDERVPQELPNMNFKTPENKGCGKLGNLSDLVIKGDNIATTHVLFSVLTPELVDRIIKMQYVLVIDEAISCVGLLDNELKKSDTTALLKSNMVYVDDENRGRLNWNEVDYPDHDGKYSKIRSMCNLSMLYCYADTFLMFEYPPKLLKELECVYVLTYLFDGSDMRCWLDLNNVPYTVLENQSLGLRSEEDIKDDIRKNLNILTNRTLKGLRQRDTTLSKSWYEKAKPDEVKKYKAMFRSCIVTNKAKAGDVFWTVFKDKQKVMQGTGYTKGVSENMPSFLPLNIRATNKYADYSLCMYGVNLFKNPVEVGYLRYNNIRVNEDDYALSEMIQFIWRGCIRKGEPMKVLILSDRMRKLLENWLETSDEDLVK